MDGIDLDQLTDGLMRHEMWLERYKGGVSRRLLRFLTQLRGEIEQRLALEELTPRAASRINLLLIQIHGMIEATMQRVQAELDGELRGALDTEVDYQRSLAGQIGLALEGVTDRLSLDIIYAAALSQPFQGALLSEWYRAQTRSTQTAVSKVLRQGYAEGAPLREITRRLRAVWPSEQRKLEALARTALAHMATFASRRVMLDSEVAYAQWISVLDQRTSAVCRARSNRVYKVSPTMVAPPAHMNCRSSLLALSNNRGVELPSYGDWLRRQSRATQDDVLGVNKARLWRNGLDLRRLVNAAGDELTLEQLRERYPRLWRRAGLNQAAGGRY